MKGIEQQYLRLCIESLCKARSELLRLTCEEAISKSPYGKGDCLCLDAAPEIEICSLFKDFDPHLPLVTEEIGSNVQLQVTEEQVICFSDPMDRSKPLAEFLLKQIEKNSKATEKKLGTIFQQKETIQEWESICGGDVELSGPYGSITAIRQHCILFNVMINYITGVIYIASDEKVGNIYIYDAFEDANQTFLKRTRNLMQCLSPMSFEGCNLSQQGQEKFVAFCSGKDFKKYEYNLISSQIFGHQTIEKIRENHLVYNKPGGPARILYLKDAQYAGFILSNGERICEWLGWLAYVRYCSPQMRAYEIYFDSSWTRDQILMAPGPAYSILGDTIHYEGGLPHKKFQLNISKLKLLPNPSHYRSTILICPASNDWMTVHMAMNRCVELHFE